MKYLPFGKWKSPITAEMVASRGRLNTLRWSTATDSNGDNQNSVYFSGNRDGRSFLYKWNPSNGLVELSGGINVGGSVGYGGGDFDVIHENLVFMGGKEGIHYRESIHGSNQKLFSAGLMAASPSISPDGKKVVVVTSDGVNDQLALLKLGEYDWPQRWIHGADFYMQPVWSPNGQRVAWAEWDHPHMAWEGSRVMFAELEADGLTVKKVVQVAGGVDFPASQPRFSPDGKMLAFIQDGAEWQNLMVYDLERGETRMLVQGDRFELAMPAFAQGVQTFDWFADGERIALLKFTGLRTVLCVVHLNDSSVEEIQVPGITNIDSLAVSQTDDSVAMIAAGLASSLQVLVLKNSQLQVIYRLSDKALPETFLSAPQEISWEASDGTIVYGVYYPPKNPDYAWNGQPPAFVHIHGGPTGKADVRYNAEVQYFTSRGFGWLAVNYRGSWGYGRTYREKLNGHWGLHDVEDAISGANCIGAMGLADRQRLLIIGGSAGGYTVLNALCRYPDSFKAGASLYGVSDLFGLAGDTHKLEAHYTDTLVGELPEEAALYEAWSPLYHAGKITAPLAIFQGGQDPVVPQKQSEELVARLKAPFVYRLYEKEGHGFRQPETIRDYLETLTAFALQHLS